VKLIGWPAQGTGLHRSSLISYSLRVCGSQPGGNEKIFRMRGAWLRRLFCMRGEPGPAVCAGNQSTDPALFAAEFWSAGGHTLFGEEFGSGSLKKRRKGTLHGRGRLGLRRVGVCMESDGGSSKQTTRGSKRTKRMRMKSQSRVNRACGRTESRRGRGRRVTLELTRYRGWRRSKVKEV
jgi:hypothetical protein